MERLFILLFILLISCNIFDIAATRYIVDKDYWIEINPIQEKVMERYGYVGVTTLKMFWIFILGTFILIYEKKKKVIPYLASITGVYFCLNVCQIIFILFFI